jgi:hypothetical protein
MQKGLIHQHFKGNQKITLQHPQNWSPEAKNFLENTSFRSLKEIRMVNFMYILTLSEQVQLIFIAPFYKARSVANNYSPIYKLCSTRTNSPTFEIKVISYEIRGENFLLVQSLTKSASPQTHCESFSAPR